MAGSTLAVTDKEYNPCQTKRIKMFGALIILIVLVLILAGILMELGNVPEEYEPVFRYLTNRYLIYQSVAILGFFQAYYWFGRS